MGTSKAGTRYGKSWWAAYGDPKILITGKIIKPRDKP